MRPRIALFLSLWFSASAASAAEIAWKPWSKDVLDRAAAERRLVLLDVGAVWCHWCHVMDEVTYRDPAVVGLVRRGYLPVRVDQDADPALSARYEAWGWPATIILRPDGVELVKFKGYVPPERMASLLEEVLKDPTPGPSAEVEAEPEPARALRYLLSPGVVGELHVPGGVLLAEREWSAEPLHFTVVGPRGDERTRALYRAARKASPVAKRTELWDPAEGPRRETGVTFPKLDRPALYLCGARSCSRPVFDADKVAAVVPRSG